MKKNNPIKIRRTWTRHPAEKIKEDKESIDPCVECGKYKPDPNECFKCKCCGEPVEEIGNA